ncbi:DNA polymerase III subunit alpha [Tessaracoccus sp. SD287]|uniref:DNA polymerase III subunit alpha n=1 Tax=Tessaracoccus sp. SD287 TaxID=2782008 RepID=UPI001A95E18E|nr:DNA polymerase III subunit alpha [Tessaracoccus sp. SD287]MBO1031558.1 DNA polymerase III subunit alpha [Tessaracoccus sp. SD287]
MNDPFVHLRVASGYSLQHGASHPGDLVAAAADHGMDTLALTDRDGLYGVIRFAKACLKHGIAPVVGADLAIPDPWRRAPARRSTAARGGEIRDQRLPRVVVLATSRQGWANLCRLTTATHLAGHRGEPVSSLDLIAEHAGDGDLLVMLGSDSPVGVAVAEGDRLRAQAELRRWVEALGPDQVALAATNHQVKGHGVNSAAQAGALVELADQHHLTAVLANQVRMARRQQAPTLDVLDAARRLVPLDLRNVDRRNAEGWLKPGKQMIDIAEQVADRSGRRGGPDGAERLIADTRLLAQRCRLDPHADLGLGEIHLPEFGVLGTTADQAMTVLRQRCEAGITSRYDHYQHPRVVQRLDEELAVIDHLGFASYFLTVGDVVGLVREMNIRCAARGSGAGSLVNHLLGISGVDPLAHGLVMERFLSPLRRALPDIDLDVESARRTEVYEKVLDVFGSERVACVAMLETYRVRHAVRDVGNALSMPPGEVDAIAKAFPHIRARDARQAMRDLPELRAAGLAERRLDVFFELVESLDGLPRHVALHPCGILLSDATLGDRTPIEASHGGFPMSQFDKDDVEDIGLLKLDVLGIRMQSAISHCLDEIDRTGHQSPPIDDLGPFDDPDTYDMIGHAATLGCFQIESPGQRELVGKFGPSTFTDIIIDISLFRPGPVKSDMVVPFLNARQGWNQPKYLHPDLEPVLAETGGVVVFHEQVIRIVAVMTGCSLAQADEVRRALGDLAGQRDVQDWFGPIARERGYPAETVEKVWQVLVAFASFGFCKAHAAAFALPTYQSAWLKRHYPAHFVAGLLTHDPGMYPKRLIAEEARRMQVPLLGLDVNRSGATWQVECLHGPDWVPPLSGHADPRATPTPTTVLDAQGLPDDSAHGLRTALAEVKGISQSEVLRIAAGQPYTSLTDFWNRAGVEAPVVERLVLAGAFDDLYRVGQDVGVLAEGQVTRRDLLLATADLRRLQVVENRTAARARGLVRSKSYEQPREDGPASVRTRARRQAAAEVVPSRVAESFTGIQLALDFSDPAEADPTVEQWDPDLWGHDPHDPHDPDDRTSGPGQTTPTDVAATGLPEMTRIERLASELDILGMDTSQHIMDFYRSFLDDLGIAWSRDLHGRRNQSEVLVAGVKVATQTPPVRSGRRVVFLTLDDSTGPVDATFFEDAQGAYAHTVFASWLLLVRGVIRRTGPQGLSLRATGAWDLQGLFEVWKQALESDGDRRAATAAITAIITQAPRPVEAPRGAAARMRGGQLAQGADPRDGTVGDAQQHTRAGGMGQRRVLVHPSGYQQSPYADVKPAGSPADQAPRKLWHSSPGSSGR